MSELRHAFTVGLLFLPMLLLLLMAHVTCQTFGDEALVASDAPSTDYDEDKERSEFVDNRIDSLRTYVTPAEKFMKALLVPLGWFSASNRESNSGLGRLINGITKPIRFLINPARKAAKGSFGQVLDAIGDRFKAVYPGTAWCGAGNRAQTPDDVGLFQKTDKCCRNHDQCNTNMEAGTTENGLMNNGIFTRSHCSCDADFYHCLKEVRSIVAVNIGLTYFNVLRPQCFKLEYPAYCIRYGNTRLVKNKCLDYGYDNTQNQMWQWFDSPDFQ